ncbi:MULTISPECIES: hypothetical protein [unclassified Roseobacter]|uniref:hypothetical protein n=1 Tax=unclassified Roseobacter TaxID=196798 RepID=UPI001491A68F|nr:MULTISPECIES: hypothetical protein [unclassified Roseobacter]NNW55500.1 hypothetical protein [Roseobacter sp. HKCCD8284]NNY17313.1 hypothetical protein [Roseobacter sp. HKCCD8191]
MSDTFGPIGNVRATARPVRGGSPTATAQSFGAGVARALGGLGDSMNAFEMTEEQVLDARQNLELAHLQRAERLERANIATDLIRAEAAMAQEVEELRRNAPVDGSGFTNEVEQLVTARTAELRSAIPENLRPEFEERLARIETAFSVEAYTEELRASDTAYINNVEETLQTAINQIQTGEGDPEVWREEMVEILANSPLDQAQTETILNATLDSIDIAEYTLEVGAAAENPSMDRGALPGPVDGRDTRATGLTGEARGLLNIVGGAEGSPSANVQINIQPDTSSPDQRLLNILSNTVETVFGRGAQINISSGHEGRATGTRRHPAGTAADFTITLPDGSVLPYMDPRGNNIVNRFLLEAARAGIHGIGYGSDYMGNSFHMDVFPPEAYQNGEGHVWSEAAEVPGLLNIMQNFEGEVNYQQLDGGGSFSDYASHPGNEPAGRYLITPEDWEIARTTLNLPNFAPENQDRAAWWLMGQAYNQATGRDLQADLSSADPVLIERARQVLLAQTRPGTDEQRFAYIADVPVEQFYRTVTNSRPTLPSVVYDERFSGISIDARVSIFQDALNNANNNIIDIQSRANESRGNFLDQLNARIGLGEAGEQDIQQAINDYGLVPTEIEDLYRSLNRARDSVASVASFDARINSDLFTFDRSQQTNRTAADNYSTERHMQSIADRDSEAFNQRVVRDVEQMGYVPTPVSENLLRLSRSANPEDVDFAMQSLAALYSNNPQVFEQDFNDTETRVARYMSTLGGAVPRDEAMAVVQQIRNPSNAEILRVADQTYTASIREHPDWFSARSIADAALDRGRESPIATPQMAASLQAEFAELFRQSLNAGIGPEDARDQAHEALRTRWGESRISDRTGVIMRRPPENYYPADLNGSYDWINEVVRNDLGLNEDQQFRLYSDHITEANIQSGQMPTYGVVVENEFGHFLPAMDGIRPSRIMFDQSQEVIENSIQEVIGIRGQLQTQAALSDLITQMTSHLHQEVELEPEAYQELLNEAVDISRRLREQGDVGRQNVASQITTSGLFALDPVAAQTIMGGSVE